MSQLDAALAAIPLWITLTALAIGIVLGWCARTVIAERRQQRLERIIDDRTAADRSHAEATEQMLVRLGLTETDSSGGLTDLADAVAEPRPYDPQHDVLHPDREHDHETGGRHERH